MAGTYQEVVLSRYFAIGLVDDGLPTGYRLDRPPPKARVPSPLIPKGPLSSVKGTHRDPSPPRLVEGPSNLKRAGAPRPLLLGSIPLPRPPGDCRP